MDYKTAKFTKIVKTANKIEKIVKKVDDSKMDKSKYEFKNITKMDSIEDLISGNDIIDEVKILKNM